MSPPRSQRVSRIVQLARVCGLLLLITLQTTNAHMNDEILSAQSEPPPDPLSAIALAEMPSIEIRQSPKPVREYALVIAFAGLPGPVSGVQASADFAVDNVECVPPMEMSGARLRPEHSIELPLQSIDANRYATALYADALTDEDYFGLGVCRWSLNWATVRFRSAQTEFVGAIPIEDIQAGRPVTLHYLVSDYERAPQPVSVVFGEETDLYTTEAGPRFTLTLTATEVAE
jgi:hypothetical protein